MHVDGIDVYFDFYIVNPNDLDTCVYNDDQTQMATSPEINELVGYNTIIIMIIICSIFD